jgi:hypothetical protein
VQTPPVLSTDPWAGQNIGIQLLATPTAQTTGGYWDADNVRLIETTALNLTNPGLTNGQIQFTVQSEPSQIVKILASTNLAQPLVSWTNIATLTNLSGAMPFIDTAPQVKQRFYTAQSSP